MKNKKLLLMRMAAAIVTFGSIYLFAPWQQALYYLKPLPASIEAETKAAVEQGVDGIIVYVHKNGSEPEFYTSGWHNRQNKIPADPHALFKIASIGKLYDAAAVTKLAANGSLSLEQSLAHYLPGIADRIENSEKITLRMMLQHRSGIANFTDHPKFNWGESSLDVMQLVLDTPADFEPGTDYSYSNSNFLLLQKIMEEVLGYSYWQYIRQQLLAPHGLNRTFASVNDVELNQLMSGYYVGIEADLKQLDQGYIASAQDVGVFLRALNDGSLFSDKERQIYATLYEYEHTGWVLGYTSIARYHSDIDTVVILFVNTTGGETILLRDIVYGRILKILRQRERTS